MSELFEAKRNDRDPRHLVHLAADIIATSRECFDYLAQDIVEQFVLPFTQVTKFKADHASGKLHAYFPFHEPQVRGAGKLFHEVMNGNHQLYADLVQFTESISQKERIPNTLFEYADFLEIKEMINQKKHDKLIAITAEPNQEHLIQNEIFQAILPIRGPSGWGSVVVSPGTLLKSVAEYRFEYNNKEVGRFCMFAVCATQIVLN